MIKYRCFECNTYKEGMCMHSEILCKNCWSRADKKHESTKGRGTRKAP